MLKSKRSLGKAIKRFGDMLSSRRSSQQRKLPRSRSPQLEQFEDRLLLSISPSIVAAHTIEDGEAYQVQLSAAGDAVARWDIDWGDGTTTT